VAKGQYIAELRDGAIHLQRVDQLPALEERVTLVAIAGLLLPDELAEVAARAHFERNPGRIKVFVTTVSGASDWRFR
jgi:hypothetical protein